MRWGSIYWAKVARIDKARDAAFVNLDGDNIGLLHNADVWARQKNGTYKKGGDKEIGKTLSPGDMIAVQAKSAFLANDPDRPYASADGKSPRVSMNITLPGRYLIFAPMEGENRISRRIRSKTMRAQMMDMLESVSACHGCIMRAAALNTQTELLSREAKILSEMWDQIQEHLKGDSPQLIMLGPDAVERILSDNADKLIEHIDVSTMDHYRHVEEWCDIYAPDLVTKIRPVEIDEALEELGLFSHADIMDEIEGLGHPYSILGSGATIIIEETATLTAIDVNSAADSRGNLAINEDAAKEIGRQLRLRNLGGIIMIDFLKMKSRKEQDSLLETIRSVFDKDPCTVQIHGFTGLGLLEISRQRRTPPLADRLELIMGG